MAIPLFDMIGGNDKKLVKLLDNVRNHNPQQLAAFNHLVAQYTNALNEVIDKDRLTRNRANHLRQVFIDYVKAFPLDGDSLDAVNLIDIEMTKWILRNCHDSSI